MTQAQGSTEKLQRQAGIRLPLETGMRMSVSLDGQKDTDDSRLGVELVGLVHFEYIILRLPGIPGLRSRLIPGNWLTVRFVSDGQLCGFQAEVLTHVVKPAFLLFLAYPEVVETLSLRRHRRMTCALPMHIHSRRGDSQGLITDLSQGGCRLAIDVRGQAGLRQMAVGDEVLMRTSLSTENAPIAITCAVRSVSLETSRLFLGVSFSDADTAFRTALETFLDYSELLP